MPPRRRAGAGAPRRGRGAARQPQGGQGGPNAGPVFDTSQHQYSVMVESQTAPLLADGSIWVDAAHPLVINTACLGWKTVPSFLGNTAADAMLTSSQAVSAFLSRCHVEDSPQSKAAGERAHVLNFRLSATAWSRILSAYHDSGAFGQPCSDLPTLRSAIANTVFATPRDLAVSHADWSLGEAFNIPTGNAAADITAREALAPLRFFALASVARLEVESKPNARWSVLSSLVGAIGPCLTEASRLDETAPLHYVAHRIRQVVGVAMRDGALAFNLPDTVLAAVLPNALQPHSATPTELMNELIDALSYTASVAQRETIEEKRVFLLGRR